MTGRIMKLGTVALIALVSVCGCKDKSASETQMPADQNEVALSPAGVEAQVASLAEQKICPIMGNPIDKSIFVEHEGKKVYFCCAPCLDKFKAEPEKYVAKLPQFQE